ncbi:putrescine aminotransferase [Desulfosarcina ovata subsp. sediminis]|uniref:Taurine--pyruvate aminotransferase n=1 Tax=Desulfosarcina ovata subsp. sediminis TaxID=885957 RepID=A0A5K7ZY86_9BACT|nr:aminotransferase class III-fold pyridoxal phosphate-dependent enzyme [Desulfosarcina ovata]BBO85237.1 putrescine aminotransferase [Desulfosarcina ovata subsp. sediminis]
MRSYQDALAYSAKWLEIIHQDSESIDESTAKWISQETKHNFVNHFNAGWVNYRKSMTEAGDYGAVEWRGKGARFFDPFGNEYLDFLGGYGALDLGWSHPEVVEAVRAQALKSGIPSQELMDPLRGVLAKLMTDITPGDIDHAFFVASGTEAVEGALKIARLHTGKHSFISTVKAFHGKTSGSLSVMGKKAFRAPLQPYGAQIFFVPFGDADALERQLEICETVGIDIAGFVAEPIQGEAGAIVPPDGYWPRVREICDKFGILMICDEVQTGLGRTGALWGVDHWNVKPDIMMAAKSLGGGVMPVGCFMGSGEIWKAFEEPNPFMHTTTTGGNPMACAAAIATIQVVLRDKLPQRAAELGDYFIGQLNQLTEEFPGIYEKITGKGLLIGQHFIDNEVGYKVAAGLFRRKVLVAGTLVNAKAIRFEPPLVITQAEIDEVLNRLRDTLKSVSAGL